MCISCTAKWFTNNIIIKEGVMRKELSMLKELLSNHSLEIHILKQAIESKDITIKELQDNVEYLRKLSDRLLSKT